MFSQERVDAGFWYSRYFKVMFENREELKNRDDIIF